MPESGILKMGQEIKLVLAYLKCLINFILCIQLAFCSLVHLIYFISNWMMVEKEGGVKRHRRYRALTYKGFTYGVLSRRQNVPTFTP